MSDEIKTHESYGIIGISRYQSASADVMFGSSIKHRNAITITVKRASVIRRHTQDWYHAEEPLIRLRMSQNQFAELITTPNVGDGVPCTLGYVNSDKMEDPPFEHTAQKHRDEFAVFAQTIASEQGRNMKESLEILKNKPSIGKTDRQTIISAFELILQDLQKNLPFHLDQFQRQMDKTITEAKSEIEAFVEHKVRSVGLEAIRDQMPQLPEYREANDD